MTTDRELLELAARAAGVNLRDATFDGWGDVIQSNWNPIADDGDALRLMARLNINVSYRENINGAWVVAEHEGIDFCPESLDGPHEDVATRRAIVKAAASIGKESK